MTAYQNIVPHLIHQIENTEMTGKCTFHSKIFWTEMKIGAKWKWSLTNLFKLQIRWLSKLQTTSRFKSHTPLLILIAKAIIDCNKCSETLTGATIFIFRSYQIWIWEIIDGQCTVGRCYWSSQLSTSWSADWCRWHSCVCWRHCSLRPFRCTANETWRIMLTISELIFN